MIQAISSYLPFHFYTIPNPNKKNLSDSPFQDVESLEDLAQILKSHQCEISDWKLWQNEIREQLHKWSDDLVAVDEFLSEITAFGMRRDPQALMALMGGIVSVDVLNEVIKHKERFSAIPFENAFEWAAQQADLYPEPQAENIESRLDSEWRKYRLTVLHFIPNIINIFLGAFNFLDTTRKYTTLWEKHLILEIVYKFFIIPYLIYKIVEPFFETTLKVYVVTALIISTIGLLVTIYQRWLRPLPDSIVNCNNLDNRMEQGFIDPKVGQTKELAQLIAALEEGSNVLLIGKSGDGKTALVHHLIALKHAKELPESLQKLKMFEADCGLMISSVSFGHSELISQTKDQCEGFEDRILLYFDEFYQIVVNEDAFRTFKKRLLEDKPSPKIVISISLRELEELQKLDVDGSFMRRVVPIFVESCDEDQNRLILQEFARRAARNVLVTEDAIETAHELACDKDYFPEIGCPAKGLKLLTDAVGICRSSFESHYLTEEVSDALQEYQSMKLQAMREVKVPTDALKKLKEKKEDIEQLQTELEEQKEQARKIRQGIEHQNTLHDAYYRIARRLAAGREDGEEQANDETRISEEDKVLYLWTYFYAIDAMKAIIQDQINEVRPHLPVQVDEQLIHQVYAASKKLYKADQKDKTPEEQEADEEADSDEIYAN